MAFAQLTYRESLRDIEACLSAQASKLYHGMLLQLHRGGRLPLGDALPSKTPKGHNRGCSINPGEETVRNLVILVGLLALTTVGASPRGADLTAKTMPSYDQAAIARRGYFYVGGFYVGEHGKQLMHDQMYVEVLTPRHPRQRYPLVLIHGAAQTATNWMGTPDGRPGWADYFVRQGYMVYLVDQPARGRSPWLPDVDGKLATFAEEAIESRFTAPEQFNLWPQAKLHSQWPGTGRIGDPIFDAFYATQVPYLADGAETQRLNQQAAAALLDRIGPAIILTHSQSGPFGWLIADARPKLVKSSNRG
jgi:pimeloyl-ACP methyl ester carboxylesterase